MRSAVALRDVVRVGGKRLVVGVVPLHGDFHVDRNLLAGILCRLLQNGLLNVDWILVDGVARCVLVEHEGADAAFALKAHVLSGAFVVQLNVHAGI